MKKNRNLKIIIALLIVGVLYIVIVFLLRGPNTIPNQGYLINSNLDAFFCHEETCEWQDLESLIYDNKTFRIYQRDNYLGDYQLKYNETWNFYQNEKWQLVVGDFLAIDKNLKCELIDYQIEELNDDDLREIKALLLKREITIEKTDIGTNYAYLADIDNNGVTDKVVTISNQIEGKQTEHYFTALLIKLNNNWQIALLEDKVDVSKYTLPFYTINELLTVNNQSKIIINKGYYDNMGESESIMLNLNKNKFELETLK